MPYQFALGYFMPEVRELCTLYAYINIFCVYNYMISCDLSYLMKVIICLHTVKWYIVFLSDSDGGVLFV